MPNPKTAQEEWREEEARLRGEVLALEREIADQLSEQSRIYATKIVANSGVARLYVASRRIGEKTIGDDEAKRIENSLDPSAQFEWGRWRCDQISRLVTAKRRKLAQAQKRLDYVRGHLRRIANEAGSNHGGAWMEEQSPSLPLYLGERLVALQSLARLTRGSG